MLVNEFAVRQQHAGRILRGACDALTMPRPHAPLADVAPALGGARRPDQGEAAQAAARLGISG